MWGSGSYSPRSVPSGQSRGTWREGGLKTKLVNLDAQSKYIEAPFRSRANQEDGAYKLLGKPQETAPSRCLVGWQPAWFCTYLIRVSRGASPQESIEYPSVQKTLLPP